jgi:L-lactate permease
MFRDIVAVGCHTSIWVTLLVCVLIDQARKTTKIWLSIFCILVSFFLYALLLSSFLYKNSLNSSLDSEYVSITFAVWRICWISHRRYCDRHVKKKRSSKSSRGTATLSLTFSLYGGGWSTPLPGRFTPGKVTHHRFSIKKIFAFIISYNLTLKSVHSIQHQF